MVGVAAFGATTDSGTGMATAGAGWCRQWARLRSASKGVALARRRGRPGWGRWRRRTAERFENAFERNAFLELAHLDQRNFEDDIFRQRIAQAAFEMTQLLQNAERGAARDQAETSASTFFSGVEISPSNAVGRLDK